MKTLGKLLLTVGSGYLFYLAAIWLFKGNKELAMIITLSVALHEGGHAIALFYYGHRNISMFFVPLLGAAVSMDHEKVKKMLQLEQAVVALAGPFVNVILIICGLFFLTADGGRTTGMAVMSINASLAIFNLLPFGFIDGGRFVKAIFFSTDENTDKIISALISSLAILIGFSLVLITGRFSLLYILIYFGIRRESNLDDADGYLSKKAMTMSQAKIMLAVYLIMLISAWILNVFLPGWNELY